MAELKVRCFVKRDGKIEPFHGYTDKEWEPIQKLLTETLSEYYTQHPEEYRKLKGKEFKCI